MLGVGAAYLIAFGLGRLFGDLFDIDPYVSPRSMIVAYCLGVVITFIAVVYASIRNSRLNIVAAIRDIPDVSSPVRKKRTLIIAALALVVGALLTVVGLSNNSAFPAYARAEHPALWRGDDPALLRGVEPARLFDRRTLPDRPLAAARHSNRERSSATLNGDIEMFFLSGIFLVAGSTILIVQNLDVLLGLVNRIGGLFGGALPSVRTAIAFPGATPSRTGMTIAMFSLIIFSLVMFSTINENFSKAFLGDEANAGWDVRADQGGANPIGTSQDFEALLQDRGFDTSQISAIGMGTTGFGGKVRREGGEWGNIFIHGMDEGLITDSDDHLPAARGGVSRMTPRSSKRSRPIRTWRSSIRTALAGQGGFGGPVEDPFTLERSRW